LPAQATRNRLSFPLLETIRVPTLLLTGDADLYTPPPVLELFAARIRDSVSLVLHGVGHSAYWEQPALFNQAILDFLARR
jgi:pimeloyl-ACP methyl ester carboxylesterase